MTTSHVALPNILLGRDAFPELLQRQVTPSLLEEALTKVLVGRDPFLDSCAEVEMSLGGKSSASRMVARMLEPWLATRAA
jgi:lipid-A-disaccharide synthase